MKTTLRIRNGCITLSHALNPNGPNPKSKIVPSILKITETSVLSASFFNPHIINRNTATRLCSSMAEVSVAKQFESFNSHLQESCALRERIRSVAAEIESVTRFMNACLLHVHQSRPLPKILDEVNTQIDVLRGLYRKLAEIIRECPGQYYRYHGDWKSVTETVVSLLAFMHWLETGNLLLHSEADEKLGLNESEFGLDVEEYLVGICFMSNELPRYVVNRVTAGDYDCPRKVLEFLTDLHTSFRMLNLRNDFLRRKFDGMKYDLKKVEEVYYDVKIRGLAAATDSTGEQVQ